MVICQVSLQAPAAGHGHACMVLTCVTSWNGGRAGIPLRVRLFTRMAGPAI